MIPHYFYSLANVHQKYFTDQYPSAEDCVVLDQQILAIQKDIDHIGKRILVNYPDISPELLQSTSGLIQAAYIKAAAKIRLDSLNFLKGLLASKQNSFSLGSCRNKIELVRQEETAAVFSETSAKQEGQVLTQSKTKQYFLIGTGSILLLTTLIVVLIKRNKTK